MGTLIDRFEGHDGPVRGLDFHKTQPLFASCGDDYTIKVWSLQTRKCLFTLTGHLDYVRTCFFHTDLPWIISASDDQTIRIWNWQNRQEIACLTGHNHYVMSAQFHPKEDLIVSASLDQTVRVWDISGLRKKHSAPSNTANSFEDQLARANAPQQDIFGNTDAIVKFVLEGHDRGVNWASFHPKLPLIVSSGDDRVLKIWRMSETKAWEVDSCRGHTNNILCCLFHPYQDIILSVSEDKTIRTWDLNKRTGIQQFKRENDKFWYISAHPEINLFAAAHDSGVMVFKLERERPASALSQNSIFYINQEKQVKSFDIGQDHENLPLLSLKKIGNPWTPFRNLSYNPSERAILATTKNDSGGIYELVNLPKDSSGAIEPTGTLQGSGDQALFITRNRFAVFSKTSQQVEIKDLSNTVTKTVNLPIQVKDIANGGPGLLLLLGTSSVVLFDIQQKKVISELLVSGIKYVVWSIDGQYVALLGKHTITIATRNLDIVASLHETIRIKSATWDDNGVLLYSTLNHLKYSLLNGDHGILKTLDKTVYLARVKGSKVYALARGGVVEIIEIDPTEYRFKRALLTKNFNEVLRLIKNSQLVGQSIISYLQQKGYPEIALQFVQDPQTKFDLAIECGNLEVALEQAKDIEKQPVWKALGDEALAQGNHKVAEFVYQKLSQFDKLSFLYLVTGNKDNVEKMEVIASHRGDSNAKFTSGIYLNNAQSRIEILRESGMSSLAYALAKSAGLEEEAQQILAESEIDESQVSVNITDVSHEQAPTVANATSETNWPLKSTALSYFELAILGQVENLSLDEPADNGVAIDDFGMDDISGDLDDGNGPQDDGEWGFGEDDLDIEDVVDSADAGNSELENTSGVSELDFWVRNSPIAADHIAAGSFETAAQMLNRQAGISNFAPLKERFLNVYRSSKLYLGATEGLPSLPYYIRRDVDVDNYRNALPLVPGYDTLRPSLQEAYKAIKANKLENAVGLFREILYTILTLSVANEEQADECKRIIGICREYILAFSIELERRSLPATEVKRRLELAAYFTKPKLESMHAHLPLSVAMREAFSQKNYKSASEFATRFLKISSSGSGAEVANKIKRKSDQQPLDQVSIEYDHFADFDICPSTLTPVYSGLPSATDPVTGAKYHASEKGTICKITNVSIVGASSTGLRLFI